MRAAVLTVPRPIAQRPAPHRGVATARCRSRLCAAARQSLRSLPHRSARRRRRAPAAARPHHPRPPDRRRSRRGRDRDRHSRRCFLVGWNRRHMPVLPPRRRAKGAARTAGPDQQVFRAALRFARVLGRESLRRSRLHRLQRRRRLCGIRPRPRRFHRARCPEALDDLAAAPLLCAGIIGFRSLRVAGVEKGERVGLFGFGASAHLALPVLQAWNCEVFVSTRGESHRKLARRLGADWVGAERDRLPCGSTAPSPSRPAATWSSRRSPACARAAWWPINAIHLDRMPEFDYDSLLWGERQIRSVANMTRADARDFLQLAAEIKLRPRVTVFPAGTGQ